jgi:hypothetical protein
MVWGTFPSGDNGADGGWEGGWVNTDRTKLYRFSVWVRRTSSTTGGTFYFGLHTNGTGDTYNLPSGSSEANPYWDYRGISGLPIQNQWYLFVGHLYPYGYTGTVVHPESGYYTISGGKIGNNTGNILNDVKFPSDATQVYSRVYHYYCGDNTSRLEFYQPRIDLRDGTEPTINDLLGDCESTFRDSEGNNKIYGVSPVDFTSYNNTKVLRLDGSTMVRTISGLSLSNPYTILGVDRYNGLGGNNRGRTITASTGNWLMNHWNNSRYPYYANGWVGSNYATESTNNWEIGIVTGASGDYHCYYDGVDKTVSTAGGSAGPGTISFGNMGGTSSEPSNCDIGLFLVWNRVLTSIEIPIVYGAIRSRFGQ